MTVLASTIIGQVRPPLIDTGSQPRWSDTELLTYMSDGQRTMVALSPSITAVRVVVQLAAGSRQAIPADGHVLLDVVRNMGLDGTSPGRAVRIINRELLDAYRPTWTADPASPTLQNYIFNPIEPTAFYTYPPASGAGFVELLYSQVPPELTATSDPLTIPDLYQTALFYYVMFRAHSKDNDFGSAAQAQNYMALFQSFMGTGRTGDLAESPNQQLGPPDLNTRGAAQ